MEFTNSALVTHTHISPCKTNNRKNSIYIISPHCVVGHATVESLGNLFSNRERCASSNYGIDDNCGVGMYVEERDRSWCTSSSWNDDRAVTIEIASDATHPYKMSKNAIDTTVKLMADICKRNGKKKILWFGNKEKTLNYVPRADEMLVTVHRWFANKACPGDYLCNLMESIVERVNKLINVYHPIDYTAHVQSIGWMETVKDWEVAGTTGKAKRLEAITINPHGVKLKARVHIQSIGWTDWVEFDNVTTLGTTGQSKRLEAIEIVSLTDGVEVEYQTHMQTYGWGTVYRNGKISNGYAGTVGQAKRIEALRIRLV